LCYDFQTQHRAVIKQGSNDHKHDRPSDGVQFTLVFVVVKSTAGKHDATQHDQHTAKQKNGLDWKKRKKKSMKVLSI
jgi:hypothetical protein